MRPPRCSFNGTVNTKFLCFSIAAADFIFSSQSSHCSPQVHHLGIEWKPKTAHWSSTVNFSRVGTALKSYANVLPQRHKSLRGCNDARLAARRAWSSSTIDRRRERLPLRPRHVMQELEFWVNQPFKVPTWTEDLRVSQVVWFHVTKRVPAQMGMWEGSGLIRRAGVVCFFRVQSSYWGTFPISQQVWQCFPFYFVCMCVLSTLLSHWCFVAQRGCNRRLL